MSDLPVAKKSLGQHWLSDQATLVKICDSASLKPTDTVLEIGPGAGTLTKILVSKVKQVVAVELDPKLAQTLPQNVVADNLKVVEQDILKFDLGDMPAGYKLVANIPYYLTSHLLRILSESANPPQTVVLLVQKEVAERVTARPGEMSLLSVSTQFFWTASLGSVVPKEVFLPPPKVDSQVLILKRRVKPLFENTAEKAFFRLVKAGFSARRKTLLNSLSAGLRVSKPVAEKLLVKAHINPNCRPQELSLEDWYRLYLLSE